MVQLEWKGIISEIRFQRELRESRHPGDSSVIVELRQWFDLFRPKYFRRTAIALAIPFFQQVRLSCHEVNCTRL